MPELPEVHTTVTGLQNTVVGLSISDVWTNYKSLYPPYKNQIKNPTYFKKFKKEIVGTTITSVERRHKNILIHLSSGKTILVHMKMTGHIMYGKYKFKGQNSKVKNTKTGWENESWIPDDDNKHLHDPFNRHIRLVFSLSDNKHLVLSDMRKFAKVSLLDSATLHEHKELKDIGPEPLEKSFDYALFKERVLSKKTAPIKSVLMDQTVVAGIGNIYSDEILFLAGVHPESTLGNIPEEKLQDIFTHIKPTLRKGIKFGGDSTSDYRDITGARGKFQGKHNAYRKTGEACPKKDGGMIERKVIRGRSAHFCPIHQTKY